MGNINFLASFRSLQAREFTTSWKSPANIAFVKYWGKKGYQLPANPSLSMTLKDCYTQTSTSFSPSSDLKVELYLDGIVQDSFGRKIEKYLRSLETELPWLRSVSVKIETTNTFPHGTGIASSASGLSAFALGLMDYAYHLTETERGDVFFKQASYLARLGSGSACRSLYGGFTAWGESEFTETSDLYATPFKVHSELALLHDTVLVIDETEKKVSSRQGHGRMSEHAFAEARFVQAKKNFSLMAQSLINGDLELVGQILESEALSLHAMMMTSPDAYTLIKPNTLAAMELIWDFRRQTKLPLYFTLDAGPNLHLIYPNSDYEKIRTFITHELAPLSIKIINDQTGQGPLHVVS